MKVLTFALGLLLLIVLEVLRVYLIMPFPGSQRMDSLAFAYALHRFIWPARVVLLAVSLPGAWQLLTRGSNWKRVGTLLPLFAYGAVFYFTNFVALAERMFKQPTHTVLVTREKNVVDLERLVLGVVREGEARAYPIEIIGYHHQVRDEPLLVTYCTVCRTGRVYLPGSERFRLVGMDHFNAMFEDATTGSWWRQASGRAVAGPRTGEMLTSFESQQMTLKAWLELHPRSLILQPEAEFQAEYTSLRGFDDGTRGGALTGRNASSWQDKSWVIGLVSGERARAYDWNELQQAQTINDRLGSVSVVLWASPDGKSFGARARELDGRVLTFSRDPNSKTLTDAETNSVWNDDGLCTAGELKDRRLATIESHQEFWHSWREFHPATDSWRAGVP